MPTSKSYSIIKQRGKCSRRYSYSSCDAPGQFVSSSSCRCLSWIKLDNPLDVSSGQPMKIFTNRFYIHSISNDFLQYYLLAIVLANFSLSTSVVDRNRVLANTIVEIVLLMIALLIYNQLQYLLCERIWNKETNFAQRFCFPHSPVFPVTYQVLTLRVDLNHRQYIQAKHL